MKHRYKIQIGEWVNVYSTQTLVIDTDAKLDNMSAEQLANFLDLTTDNVEYSEEDFDWTTEEHEDWDRQGEVKILDKQELDDGRTL